MEFFKRLNIKIQMILILLGAAITTFIFLYVRSNARLKNQMKYELDRIKKQTELTHLEKDSKEKEEKIIELKRQEADIVEKIKFIEEKDIKGEEITDDELEDFFSSRGF